MSAKKEKTGSDVNLSQSSAGLRKLLIGAGWETGETASEAFDIDLCCFALGRDNMTREDEDFVFYNNPQGAALAIKHLGDNRTGDKDSDDEAILIELDSLSFDVWRIVFVVSIYQGNDRDENLGHLKQIVLRAENADSGIEIHRLSVPGARLGDVSAVKLGEIYREGVEWHFVSMNETIKGGLAEIARSYGIQISSTT